MRISVILCTYNRCESLPKALASVVASTFPVPTEWEVLVVDNNSRDQTRSVVEEFCREHPAIVRYLFEPTPGKSHALNSGIQASRGEILAFMDDDVRVEPTWLHNLTVNVDDSWAGSGGRILGDWAVKPPAWLAVNGPYALPGTLAIFDPDVEAGDLIIPPYGTNMAFRKSMFDKYGGFRTDLGPRPDSMVRNEDTEFGRRVLAANERLRYEPSAIVYHPVQQERIRKAYFLKWWFDYGRANVREFGVPPSRRYYWGVPRGHLYKMGQLTKRWMTARTPAERFFKRLKVWTIMGEMVEANRQFMSKGRGHHAR